MAATQPARTAQQSGTDGATRVCQVAVLTPPGRGAVASIVVEGPHARQLVGRLFTPFALRPLEAFPADRIVVGRWQGRGDRGSEIPGEELVVSCRDQEYVEVHCHGGAAAVSSLVHSLIAEGCQLVPAAYWFRAGEPDRIVADARLALAEARTTRVAAILLDQYRGVLSHAVDETLQHLAAGRPQTAARQWQDLLAWSPFGERLIRPWQIVVVGRTNVGKSSLVNALLGYQRALVCPEAGTTRDILTDVTAITGWPVELVDTAGMRTAETEIESEGIRRARERAATADLLLVVTDGSQPWEHDDRYWPAPLRCGVLLVHNKSDLVTTLPRNRPPGILASATTGAGIAELIEAISRSLVPHVPPPGTPVPFLPEHTKSLTQALAATQRGDHERSEQVIRQLLWHMTRD